MYEWIGAIGYHELKKATYIYVEGEVSDLHNTYGLYENYKYCFAFLREISHYLELLWELKDHSSFVRDGFIHFHNCVNPKDGETQKASLSNVLSTNDGQHVITTFTREELNRASTKFNNLNFDFSVTRSDGQYALMNPLTKDIMDRSERVRSFIIVARCESILPFKIFNYCTALECLFTTDNTEVSHKIAERAALLIGESFDNRIEIFNLIKKAYGIRSKLTHGQAINESEENLIRYSQNLDEILRNIVNIHNEFMSYNKNQLEDFFTNLLFD
ncbi:HEPN domain-containing protein [Paenibacillus lemnae]|nr:HEPN domain-containing protein [Paenibacillus lemnae]